VAEIKSALELALEKAAQYGKASPEELAESRYKEEGRVLAVKFLRGEGDLEAELQAFPAQAQPTLRGAVKEVFLRNISLPKNGEADERRDRALEGLAMVASNPKAMARLRAELAQVLQNFLQVRDSAYQQLKARFGATVGNMQRALEAQYQRRVKLEVEQISQFQEEWRRFQGSLNDQFEPMLEDLKSKMQNL
jgi:hypothetical protein